jgi:hypothetical protein
MIPMRFLLEIGNFPISGIYHKEATGKIANDRQFIWIPDDLAGTCCATVWPSKGSADGNKYMVKIIAKIWNERSARCVNLKS